MRLKLFENSKISSDVKTKKKLYSKYLMILMLVQGLMLP